MFRWVPAQVCEWAEPRARTATANTQCGGRRIHSTCLFLVPPLALQLLRREHRPRPWDFEHREEAALLIFLLCPEATSQTGAKEQVIYDNRPKKKNKKTKNQQQQNTFSLVCSLQKYFLNNKQSETQLWSSLLGLLFLVSLPSYGCQIMSEWMNENSCKKTGTL